jgi:hypothetical protein
VSWDEVTIAVSLSALKKAIAGSFEKLEVFLLLQNALSLLFALSLHLW